MTVPQQLESLKDSVGDRWQAVLASPSPLMESATSKPEPAIISFDQRADG